MERADRHVYQLLTKRSLLLRNYFRARYPSASAPNYVWCGVSVENDESLLEAVRKRGNLATGRGLSRRRVSVLIGRYRAAVPLSSPLPVLLGFVAARVAGVVPGAWRGAPAVVPGPGGRGFPAAAQTGLCWGRCGCARSRSASAASAGSHSVSVARIPPRPAAESRPDGDFLRHRRRRERSERPPAPSRLGGGRPGPCLAAGVPFFFKQWGGQSPKSAGRALEGFEHDGMPGLHVGVSRDDVALAGRRRPHHRRSEPHSKEMLAYRAIVRLANLTQWAVYPARDFYWLDPSAGLLAADCPSTETALYGPSVDHDPECMAERRLESICIGLLRLLV